MVPEYGPLPSLTGSALPVWVFGFDRVYKGPCNYQIEALTQVVMLARTEEHGFRV